MRTFVLTLFATFPRNHKNYRDSIVPVGTGFIGKSAMINPRLTEPLFVTQLKWTPVWCLFWTCIYSIENCNQIGALYFWEVVYFHKHANPFHSNQVVVICQKYDLVDFEDLPYPRGRSYTPRFCIKMTAKDDRTTIKNHQRFRVSEKKTLGW